jgi:hypothetical protein
MFQLSKITSRLILTSVLSIFSTVQVGGQDAQDFQARLAYERYVNEDTTEIVYREGGIRNTFPIAITECYQVFTENTEIQSRFLAVSQRENPDSLTVYEMFSKDLVFQRDWDSSWITCSFRWIEGYVSMGLVDTQGNYLDFVQLDTNGDIVDTVRLEQDRSLYNETGAQLAQWIPDYPSSSGWYEEDYPFWFSRYSSYIIISVYLDEDQNIVRGGVGGRRHTVILDTVEGEIIEILENAPIIEPSSRFLSGVHIQDFEFSYTGDYLFYVSQYVTVYDVVEDEYLVQIDLNNEYEPYDLGRIIHWSPDGRYVSFTLYDDGNFIATVDVVSGKLYVSESLYVGHNLRWLSGQFRLTWVNPEQELIIYDAKTDTTSILDDNVVWIIGS